MTKVRSKNMSNFWVIFIEISFIVAGLGCIVLVPLVAYDIVQIEDLEDWGPLAFGGAGLVSMLIGILAFIIIRKSVFFSLKTFGRTAMVEEGSGVDLLYAPDRKHTKTEDQFLAEVARFGAHAMDRIGQKEGIRQLNIWVEGKIPLENGSGKRIWKGVRLVLDKASWRGPAIGNISNLAALDQGQCLSLCSLHYVDESEFPEWPKTHIGP